MSDADSVRRVQRACHCRESSKSLPLSGEFKQLGYAGARFFQFWVKVRKHGISTRHLKSDTCNHARPASGEGEGEGGGQVARWTRGRAGGSKWSPLSQSLYFDHPAPAFAPPPFPPPLLSRIILHTHTLAHTHTHTHTIHSVIFTPFFSPQDCLWLPLSLSLTHKHTHTRAEKIFHTFLFTHTHTAVSVASSEYANNSMTRNSPYFNPSPFPLVPLQPTTALSLQAGNAQQFFQQ